MTRTKLDWEVVADNLHKGDATTAGGRELPSEKVNVASKGVVFASVSSDGITLQQYER